MSDDLNDLHPDLPPLPPPEVEDDLRRQTREVGDLVRRVREDMYGPSPVIGHAVEHSIEDPFTGEITVRFRLDREN